MSTISVIDLTATMWRDLTITLLYNWACMATVVVGTDIFLLSGLSMMRVAKKEVYASLENPLIKGVASAS